MNMPRPVVHFRNADFELQITRDVGRVLYFDHPYEEISCAEYNDRRKRIVMWEPPLMSLMAKAGFDIVRKERPDEELEDLYVKQQAERIDGEWSQLVP